MRNMKKWLALALALVMVFAMAACAVADGETTTYNITAPATSHTYEIYQIFTGEYAAGKLNDVQWGTNGKGTGAVDSSILQEIQSASGEAAILETVKKYVNLEGDPVGTVTNGSAYAAVPGYYLIKDQDKSVSGQDAYTLYLVKVVNADITITPKTGIPTVQKKVKDTNDSTGTTSGWQDSADHDIGDTIQYQLTATMGDLSHFNHYYVEFVDTMTNLTFTKITSVKVGDNVLVKDETQSDYDYSWDAQSKTLKVWIFDVTDYEAGEGTNVVVEYEATLDPSANIGSTGNPNEVYLLFTNNPNNTGNGESKPDDTGKTPTDKNIVFTYKVTANKIKSDETALAGAAFELFKKNAAGEYKSLGVVGATKNGEGEYVADGKNATSFSWTGIDDGDYKIVEVVTPVGYNAIDPIEFTVSATHDEDAADPTLITLTGGDKFRGEVSTGELSANIVNLTGTELPSTGGMGTTVLYVGGGVLVLAAVVLLIAKRRSNA